MNHCIDSALRLNECFTRCTVGEGRAQASNLGVLFVPLKTYGQSFVRGEITHSSRARDTGAFVLSVCVCTECVERERDREGEWKKEGEEQKEAKERAGGQHYPAIKSLG